MDYLSRNVAINLKRLRKSKGWSLDQLAEQTGVSKSMLAQIEKGVANPSLGVLGKITSGLRIEFQKLIESPRIEGQLIVPDDILPIKELTHQYKVWNCFPFEENHILEIYQIDIEPGCSYTSGSHGEKTREYLTVTEGSLTVECDDKFQLVQKNQMYCLETDRVHVYHNQGLNKTRCICCFLDYH